jgi:4-hydroxybenzoate polyprenyltransferase
MQKIKIFLEMIKFPHTVFALPFALSSMFIAGNGLPGMTKFFWIVLAMAGARTGAMAFNRYADMHIDARNPRTIDRALPKGLLSATQVIFYVTISFGLFIYSAYMLNKLCFYLSFLAVFFLMFYSYTKRFTSFAHVFLGIALGGAPVGAWIAIKGNIDMEAILLGFAVVFWVAGFDVFYALQDIEFDKRNQLYSIPSKYGIKKSIFIARLFHFLMMVFLFSLFLIYPFGIIYILGVGVVAVLLIYEHSLVKPDNLTRLDVAFFNMNGYISIVFFVFVVGDIYWRKFL